MQSIYISAKFSYMKEKTSKNRQPLYIVVSVMHTISSGVSQHTICSGNTKEIK